MKHTTALIILVAASLGVGLYFLSVSKVDTLVDDSIQKNLTTIPVGVSPISHASFVLTFDQATIYNDPVGSVSAYSSYSEPDFVLISDIHSDHLSVETLNGIVGSSTVIIAPEAVATTLPVTLREKTVVMSNGDIHKVSGVTIEATPMYNLPEAEDSRHVKGRGNGYLLTRGDTIIYIAGDTADIPEMRALEGIDYAFVPMNPPFTMDVDVAADAVLDFSPLIVYPYHYRGSDGLSDITEFTRLVAVGNPAIEVRRLDWYPAAE